MKIGIDLLHLDWWAVFPSATLTFDDLGNAANMITIDVNFPLTNLHDPANPVLPFYLSGYTRISWIGGATSFAIVADLTAPAPCDFGVLSDCLDGAGGVVFGTPLIQEIYLEYSADNIAWQPFASVTTDSNNSKRATSGRSVVFKPLDGVTVSARYWRYRFVTTAVPAPPTGQHITLGYMGFYAEVYSADVQTPQVVNVSNSIESVGQNGTPFVTTRKPNRMAMLPVVENQELAPFTVPDVATVQFVGGQQSIERAEFTDGRRFPIYAMIIDELHANAPAAISNQTQLALNATGYMGVIRDSYTLEFLDNCPDIAPARGIEFREWT